MQRWKLRKIRKTGRKFFRRSLLHRSRRLSLADSDPLLFVWSQFNNNLSVFQNNFVKIFSAKTFVYERLQNKLINFNKLNLVVAYFHFSNKLHCQKIICRIEIHSLNNFTEFGRFYQVLFFYLLSLAKFDIFRQILNTSIWRFLINLTEKVFSNLPISGCNWSAFPNMQHDPKFKHNHNFSSI